MSGLSPRTREILRLRFQHDLTHAEIGERFAISQMQVSRLLRQAPQDLSDAAGREPALAGGEAA